VGVLTPDTGDATAPEEGAAADTASPTGIPVPAAVVQVRRSGGFAGIRRQRTVALDELPEDDAQQWRGLLLGGALGELVARRGRPVPDAFTYHVACPPEADEVDLPEPDLPEAVRSLFQRTLET
jgi:hypothetical protein